MRVILISVALIGLATVHCGGQQAGDRPSPPPNQPVETPPPPIPAPEPWPCAQEGDVDGDGHPDRVELSLDHARIRVKGRTVAVPLPACAVLRLCLGDLDGDGRANIVAGVIRPTTKDGTFRQRLFAYAFDGRSVRPLFLGTKGSGALLHFGLVDLDDDGRVEVVARERTGDGQTSRVYGWESFGLRERPELSPAAPPYRFHPPPLERLDFSGEVRGLDGLGDVSWSSTRTPARARSVTVRRGLSNVANRASFRWLSRAARERLETEGFVVLRPREPPAEFHSLYIENQYLGLPSFITADTALHFTHLVFDEVLQNTEQEVLGPALARLIDGMRWQADRLSDRVPEGLAAPLDLLRLRLDVAGTLLQGDLSGLDEARRRAVESELEVIERGASKSSSRLGIEPSIFVVRGHYTKSEALGRYFKATLLLSTAGTSDPREAALMTALALSDPTHRRLLGLLDGAGRAFVGPPVNRTPIELRPRALRAFGPQPELSSLDTSEPWTGVAGGGAGDDAVFTLLARRQPADNAVFLADPVRESLPDPLEVMSALGSARARERLLDRPDAGPGLAQRLDATSEAFREGRLGDPRSLGGRWLLALRWVVRPFPEGYPAFQRTGSWADHALVTASASWAELRRDTVLYVRPPVVWAEGGDEEALPPGEAAYVEPNPELYRELAELVGHLEGLTSASGGDFGPASRRSGPGSAAILRRNRALLELFEEASRRELRGEGLLREHHEELRRTGAALEEMLAGGGTLRLDPVPVIADVAHLHDPATGGLVSMLMAATGPVDVVVVAVPLGRRVILARGAVSSFYHFPSPELLTDEQWREMLDRGEAPERPPWGRAVKAGAGPRRRPSGRR